MSSKSHAGQAERTGRGTLSLLEMQSETDRHPPWSPKGKMTTVRWQPAV